MRAIKLLGRRDPGAARAFALLLALATAMVTLLNVPLLTNAGADALSGLLSNDPQVVHWFRGLVWVLVVHTETRIVDLTCSSVLVPMGWPRSRVAIAFISFWLIGAPISIIGSLTDVVHASPLTRLQLCMLCSVIGQLVNAVCFGTVLLRLDWNEAARVIAARANTDRDARGGRGGGDDQQTPCDAMSPSAEVPAAPEHSIQEGSG